MSDRELPGSFVRNVTGAFADGARWLDNLPALVAACTQKWDLSLAGDPFELSFNYVVPVLKAEKFAAVLKLGVPTAEFSSEARALRAFGGHGAVGLLESDESLGALLLERVNPGNTLATLNDPIRATEVAAQTMLKLWQAAPSRWNLEAWRAGLEGWLNFARVSLEPPVRLTPAWSISRRK